MVDAQEDAIRAAHRMSQLSPERITPQMSADLAQAQEVMKTGVEYLRASLPDNAELSPSVQQLNQAADSFKQAAEQFRSGQTKEGEQTAQQALGQLAATRKEIHKAVKADPDALPSAVKSSDPLADMTEQLKNSDDLQNQLRSAADQAAKLAEEQRSLAQQIKPCDTAIHRQAAEQERQLREKFDQFRKEQAQACQRAGSQTASAETALSAAAEAIDQLAANHDNPTHQKANRAAADATSALQQLANSLRQQAANQQMAEANQLQQALDEQIKFLENLEQNPDGATQEQLDQAAKNMQATTDQIKKMAEDPATREQFSDELREMLNDENKERLDKQ
jgi:DNA repair exonuclease SbcCD ATPase subunit